MTITPEFIPHDQFHTGSWLYPINGSSWYYFVKGANDNVITNEYFMGSLDQPLRELVQFLHARNIGTTPSCSGHNFDKDYFAATYGDLEEDAEEIKSRGLCLKNIENGAMHFYRNKNYNLPWSKRYFMSYSKHYQKKGVLGLKLKNKQKIMRQLMDIRIPQVVFKEKDGILFIYTGPEGKPEEKWERITGEVMRVFSEIE